MSPSEALWPNFTPQANRSGDGVTPHPNSASNFAQVPKHIFGHEDMPTRNWIICTSYYQFILTPPKHNMITDNLHLSTLPHSLHLQKRVISHAYPALACSTPMFRWSYPCLQSTLIMSGGTTYTVSIHSDILVQSNTRISWRSVVWAYEKG